MTVTVYEPGDVEAVVDIASVAFPLPPEARVTLVGFKFKVRPAGETKWVRLTVPVNPPRLVSVIN